MGTSSSIMRFSPELTGIIRRQLTRGDSFTKSNDSHISKAKKINQQYLSKQDDQPVDDQIDQIFNNDDVKDLLYLSNNMAYRIATDDEIPSIIYDTLKDNKIEKDIDGDVLDFANSLKMENCYIDLFSKYIEHLASQ